MQTHTAVEGTVEHRQLAVVADSQQKQFTGLIGGKYQAGPLLYQPGGELTGSQKLDSVGAFLLSHGSARYKASVRILSLVRTRIGTVRSPGCSNGSILKRHGRPVSNGAVLIGIVEVVIMVSSPMKIF
jgi:hypothetical protein